jgi:transposase
MLRELRVSEMRYRAVLEVLDGAVISAVARRYGVSRQTVHAWLRPYAREGAVLNLEDRSSRPHGCAHQMAPELEARVLVLRDAHPRWGPTRIVYELAREGVVGLPGRSSVYRALVRNGRIDPATRRRRRADRFDQPARGGAVRPATENQPHSPRRGLPVVLWSILLAQRLVVDVVRVALAGYHGLDRRERVPVGGQEPQILRGRNVIRRPPAARVSPGVLGCARFERPEDHGQQDHLGATITTRTELARQILDGLDVGYPEQFGGDFVAVVFVEQSLVTG